ncbi:MAG: serine/threonine-protein kinase [Polyangiales bacterium]
MSDPPANPNALIAERFELLRPLGQGAFGAVFEAFDRVTRERVALKRLTTVDPAAVYRFKREFRMLADLRHPNVVRLRELLVDDGRWFLTMDLVPGVDLRTWLRGALRDNTTSAVPAEETMLASLADSRAAAPPPSAPPPAPRVQITLAPEEIRPVFEQLAQGIAALHEAGWLHRDLKPSNVVVTPRGDAVIVDFGLVARARHATVDSLEDGVVGTPGYMSPEQTRGEQATTASDWYAFGAMLYEALTGGGPFRGSAFQVMHRKCTEDAPDPRRARPDAPALDDLPDDLVDLALMLLAREPTSRPGASDVLRALGVQPAAAVSTVVTPLVGREAELAALHAAAMRPRDVAAFVRVTGPAGVGRSALAQRFAAELRGAGHKVFETRCHPRAAVPFQALDPITDALARRARDLDARTFTALARVFPSFGRRLRGAELPAMLDAAQARDEAFVAWRRALAQASTGGATLLVDDAHWGDVDSALLLAAALSGDHGPRPLVVLLHRSDAPPGPFLSTLGDAWTRGILATPAVLTLTPAQSD